jgi:predicted glycosyltransferase involved in capsule biosynthesis
MKFSALIPYKPNDFYRIKNLAIVKKRWQDKMSDVELIIGINYDEKFNKAKTINEAARKAAGDYFIIVDSDIVFGTKLIDKIADIAADYPWIIPWNRCCRLSKEYSVKFYNDDVFVLPKLFSVKELQSHDIDIDDLSVDGPYMNVISSEAFETIGGLDERFIGTGCEEVVMAMALTTLVGQPYRMNEHILHLYHDRSSKVEECLNYKANRELCYRYKAALGNPDAMRTLIAERNAQ